MKISVLGTGYVGLVSGVCLASRGHRVRCLDLDADKARRIQSGESPIHERDLEPLLQKVLRDKNFSAETMGPGSLVGADLVLIAVGTPSHGHRIDLSQIKVATRQIAEYIRDSDHPLSVVVKSTVIPGTTDTLVRDTLESFSGKKLGEGFGLGMNPEFLREGEAVYDFMEPDRIVMGVEDERTAELLSTVYASWPCEKIRVNTRTAEMIKYVNNALLATLVSAMNEMANLAEEVGGIDIYEVLRGIESDFRWSPKNEAGKKIRPPILDYLRPGPGFGGSCFPKDVQALRSMGESLEKKMSVLNAVLEVNDTQAKRVGALLQKHFPSLKNRRVRVLGLAFKPNTDDVRESAALKIIEDLIDRGAEVEVHDPFALPKATERLPPGRVEVCADWRKGIEAVDALVLATPWAEYAELKSPSLRPGLKGKVVVDTRRFFGPSDFSDATYLVLGHDPGKHVRRAAEAIPVRLSSAT